MVFGYTKMKLINNKMKKTRHFYTAIILVSMIAFSSQLTIASPKTISSSFEPCNKENFLPQILTLDPEEREQV